MPLALILALLQSPPPDAPRPIDAVDTLRIEEMTWMEVRDALASGKTTVLVPTGGIEQNGPYLVTGKHNYVLKATTEAMARKLKNALIAPIIPLVPEGSIDPPTGHMLYPGTISLGEETFERMLEDVCESLRATGFANIVLIGDSGGNQKGMKAVAERLSRKWPPDGARVMHLGEYYEYYYELDRWLAEEHGVKEVDEGLHDSFSVTAIMMTVDPESVRMRERVEAGRFRINGVELAPVERTIELGRLSVDWWSDRTVEAIRKRLEENP